MKSAFPFQHHFTAGTQEDFGISDRELFAAMAMQGLLSNGELLSDGHASTIKEVAETSVLVADALIAALSNQ